MRPPARCHLCTVWKVRNMPWRRLGHLGLPHFHLSFFEKGRLETENKPQCLSLHYKPDTGRCQPALVGIQAGPAQACFVALLYNPELKAINQLPRSHLNTFIAPATILHHNIITKNSICDDGVVESAVSAT